MRTTKALFAAANAATLAAPVAADDVAVQITAGLGSVDVMHGGQKITIMRNQDTKNTVNPAFAKTSRECPPFCIQPSRLARESRHRGGGGHRVREAHERRRRDHRAGRLAYPGLGGEGNDTQRDERSVDEAQPGQGRRPDLDCRDHGRRVQRPVERRG